MTEDAYYDLYARHAGHNSYYHLWRVRMARELIQRHRARVEDGCHEQSNYSAVGRQKKLPPDRELKRMWR